MKNNLLESIQSLNLEQKDYVLITMVNVRGSAPQDIGAKALISRNGLVAGTVGGGKVEAEAIKHAIEILENSEKQNPEILTWNLQKDIGMTCGGEVQFLFEHFVSNSWPIAIFGAGHVSQALCKVLANMDCQVIVIDPREEWLAPIQYSNVKTICLEKPEEYVTKLSSDHFIISMTKGHAFDVPVLINLFNADINSPFIGVIGSKTKANAIKKDLMEAGVSEKFFDKIQIPIGLPIGNNDPAEIAISIAAQLLERRDGLRTN